MKVFVLRLLGEAAAGGKPTGRNARTNPLTQVQVGHFCWPNLGGGRNVLSAQPIH
jgi:hypothetical protein